MKQHAKTLNLDGIELTHLNHSGFKLKSQNLIVYFDPFKVADEPADIIFISHEHFDHFDPASIIKLKKEGTTIIVPECLKDKVQGNIKVLMPGDSANVGNVKIETIPAYNLNLPNHPRDKNYLGYVVDVLGKRFYHAGDTDKTPEMVSLQNIDVAMLPIAGPMMHEEEAAAAIKEFKPKIVIPMHYHDEVIPGGDAEKLTGLVNESSQVQILE